MPGGQRQAKIDLQPGGEETGLGAGRMIEAGAVRGVDALIGMHLRPVSECRVGAGNTLSLAFGRENP